jgi:hypothetical protein
MRQGSTHTGTPIASPAASGAMSSLQWSQYTMRDMFGPRSYKGGRVQVWGCSPGCLILSIVVSVVLTILLNVGLAAF